MRMRGNGRRFGTGDAALRGAVAGLAGGVSILALSWLVHRGVLFTDDTVDEEWERLIKHAAKRAGLALDRRQARVARVIAQLTYASLIGAGYGVAFTRRSFPQPLRSALNSALVHAASIPAIARASAGREPKKRSRRKRRGLTIPLGSAALYGLTTSAAFRALMKV